MSKVKTSTSHVKAKASTLRSSPSTTGKYTEYAPSGVSMFSGPAISLQKAGRADALRVHFRIPLCSVAQPTTGAPWGGSALPAIVANASNSTASSLASSTMGTLAFNPLICTGVGPQTAALHRDYMVQPDCAFLFLLASSFSRYRCVSDLTLHYMPESTTATSVAFSLAFTDDFYSPTLGLAAYITSYGSSIPSFTTCKNSVNSIVFSSWAPWTRHFPVDKSYEYYLSAPIGGHLGDYNYSTYPFTDEMRQNFFGCVTVQANSTAGTSTVHGQLYWEQTIEFFDFTPIASGVSIPLSLLYNLQLLGFHRIPLLTGKESKEPIEDEVEKTKSSTSTSSSSSLSVSVPGTSTTSVLPSSSSSSSTSSLTTPSYTVLTNLLKASSSGVRTTDSGVLLTKPKNGF